MASELPANVNGINLGDYYPSTRSYNSVVYLHKKFFDDKETVHIAKANEKIENNEPKHKERKNKFKKDKMKNKSNIDVKNTDHTSVNNDEVVGQTIKFAKNIVPIVIPPNQDNLPVYYTIKTSKKSRITKCKPRDSNLTQDLTYEKQQRNKIIETFRKEKHKSHTECFSRESISRSSKSSSSENVLIINQSLCCSFSEMSDDKHKRRRKVTKKPEKHLSASESFEALATELLNTSGDAKIKIHLMNDTAKDLFYESIRNPVIEAIKESVSEIINHKGNPDCKVVHKFVQCHTQKLDNILDKLTCIEKRLKCADDKAKTQNVKVFKSALEEIGEDIIENEDMSEDEDASNACSAIEQRKARCPSAVVKLSPLQKNLEKELNVGGGEEIHGVKASVTPKVISDRLNKIPARYCWTDSTT